MLHTNTAMRPLNHLRQASYFSEYVALCPSCFVTAESRRFISNAIDSSDVAIFTRPGCPHCEESIATLRSSLGQDWRAFERPEGDSDGGDLDKDTALLRCGTTVRVEPVQRQQLALHAALQEAAGSTAVTYPHIFMRGRLIGGNTELQQLVETGALSAQLEQTRVPHGTESYPTEPSVFTPPPPALWGCVLQMKVYANVVRAYSLLYMILGFVLAATMQAPSDLTMSGS